MKGFTDFYKDFKTRGKKKAKEFYNITAKKRTRKSKEGRSRRIFNNRTALHYLVWWRN